MAFREKMLAAGQDGTRCLHGCALLEDASSFEEWSDTFKLGRKKFGEEYVPSDVYLAVRKSDDKLVGMIEFRHPLTEKLLVLSGHIGYSVLPEERGKGYATEMLRQLLPWCRAAGERYVVLSCAKENEASRQVILANGGVLDSEIREDLGLSQSGIAQRFVIPLSDRKPNGLLSAIVAARDPMKAIGLSRFFKTGPGQYGEGDNFLGLKVPLTRKIVKSLEGQVDFEELEECIQSPYHEVRLASLLALVSIYRRARKNLPLRQKCLDFYLEHTAWINNWDLVDLSCYELLGDWLLDKDRTLLYDLAKNGRTLWEKRIAIVSTMQFVRHGQVEDTLAIAGLLLAHPHDLIHKAVGWLLREVGKRDRRALTVFLTSHIGQMPRTALRYAIERFPEEERKDWLKK